MHKDKMINSLLNIIDRYDNNDVAKDDILNAYEENGYIVTIRLSTRGEANKNSPFYFGNGSTIIIKEYWLNGEVYDAKILYSTDRQEEKLKC